MVTEPLGFRWSLAGLLVDGVEGDPYLGATLTLDETRGDLYEIPGAVRPQREWFRFSDSASEPPVPVGRGTDQLFDLRTGLPKGLAGLDQFALFEAVRGDEGDALAVKWCCHESDLHVMLRSGVNGEPANRLQAGCHGGAGVEPALTGEQLRRAARHRMRSSFAAGPIVAAASVLVIGLIGTAIAARSDPSPAAFSAPSPHPPATWKITFDPRAIWFSASSLHFAWSSQSCE